MPTPPNRIEQTLTLAMLVVLIGGCFLVLQPFLTAVLWALVLAVTTWPVYARIQDWLGGRAGAAAGVMTLLIAAVVLTPFVIVGVTLADNFDRMAEFAKRLIDEGPPDPPAWVAGVPLVGGSLQAYWGDVAHDTPRLMAELRRFMDPARAALVSGSNWKAESLRLSFSRASRSSSYMLDSTGNIPQNTTGWTG